MLSHVEAAAVTEDVSFTAVPAKIPKASPDVVSKPTTCPRRGKRSAARTLKKNMTEIDCATFSSSAWMIGAVAAIALPPQIDEPTPISVLVLLSMFIILCRAYATISDVAIVHTIIGKDCCPVCRTTLRFRPKPSRTTAVCSIFFEVKLTPGLVVAPGVQISAATMPIRIEKTGPPTTGTSFPSSHDGIAIARQTPIPGAYFLIVSTTFSCSCVAQKGR